MEADDTQSGKLVDVKLQMLGVAAIVLLPSSWKKTHHYSLQNYALARLERQDAGLVCA